MAANIDEVRDTTMGVTLEQGIEEDMSVAAGSDDEAPSEASSQGSAELTGKIREGRFRINQTKGQLAEELMQLRTKLAQY